MNGDNTKKENLGIICFDFYQDLYRHKDVSEAAIRDVSEGLLTMFMDAMNENLSREILKKCWIKQLRLWRRGKLLGMMGFQWNFFKSYDILWDMISIK